jgi:lysophospholipase L1-like esterase
MDYVQEVTGIKTINMGKSGTGYANRHAQEEAFIDRVVNVPTDADVVTIYGSFNDVFSSNPLPLGEVTDTGTTTLCGFINGTIDALYTHFPDCVLGIITPCPWENSNPANTTSDASKYVDAIIEIAKRRGIPCLDLFHCSGLRPWEASYRQTYYSRDEGNGVHPNELGHKLIAPRFEQFIKTLLLN